MTRSKDILEDILTQKRLEVAGMKSRRAINPFAKLFHDSPRKLRVIAEIKRRSPTNACLFDGDIAELVRQYELGGADALSIVTDRKFFDGSTDLLAEIRAISSLPILKKDFVIDPLQVIEAHEFGADAILLIARIVEPEMLKSLVALAKQLGMVPVVEIFEEPEATVALVAGADFIAVNARNLKTQQVDLVNALHLLKRLPSDRHAMLFSGINSAEDVQLAQEAGAKAVLIGTSILTAKNRTKKLKQLRSKL